MLAFFLDKNYRFYHFFNMQQLLVWAVYSILRNLTSIPGVTNCYKYYSEPTCTNFRKFKNENTGCLRLNSVFSVVSKRQCFDSGIFLSITALTPLGVMARSHCTGPG